MKVVVNATPLISLALLDRLSLVKQMFEEVVVPLAVYEEVVIHGAGKPRIAPRWRKWFERELGVE